MFSRFLPSVSRLFRLTILLGFSVTLPAGLFAQGSVPLTAPLSGCLDVQMTGVGLFGDGVGTASVPLPPGPVVEAYIEWVGGEDRTPGGNVVDGTSTITINGTEVVGILAEPFPGDNQPGNAGYDPSRDWFSWHANIGPNGYGLIAANPGGATALNISDWDRLTGGDAQDTRINGASITLVYDTGDCLLPNTVFMLTGVDWYFNNSSELLIYSVDSAPVERVIDMYFSHAGTDAGQSSCRGGAIWMLAGTGPTPDPFTFDLNALNGSNRAYGINGGVEIVNDPFTSSSLPCTPVVNPVPDATYESGHPCAAGAASCPYRALSIDPPDGGDIEPEWGILSAKVLVPAGAEWVAFQIESEKDQSGESGSWAGGGVFVQLPTATLGDFVWNDLNFDGIQDPGEPGIPGVTVKLQDENGNVLDTTTTNDSGRYFFTDLDPGNYKVMFGEPSGFTSTLVNAGNDDTVDSDADPGNGLMTQVVTLTPGDFNDSLDAGFYMQPTIDIRLQKSVNDATPDLNGSVIFTVSVTNDGPADATGVAVKDILPAGLVYAGHSGGNYDNNTGIWTIGNLPVGGSSSLFITVSTPTVGTFNNCAEVSAADQEDSDSTPANGNMLGEDDDDCAEITVENPQIDLEVEKTADVSVVVPGQTVTFTIKVSNVGAGTALDVRVADQLPAGVTYVSDTSGGSYNPSTGIWVIGNMNPGQMKTLDIAVTIN